MGCASSVDPASRNSSVVPKRTSSGPTGYALSAAASARKLIASMSFRKIVETERTIEVYGNLYEWSGSWLIPLSLLGFASEECCQCVANFLKPQCLQKGDMLFHEGESGNSLFFVNCGSVNLESKSTKSSHILEARNFFGHLDLLLSGRRSATITALSDGCQLLELSSDDFFQVIERHPEVASAVYKHLSYETKEQINRQARAVEAHHEHYGDMYCLTSRSISDAAASADHSPISSSDPTPSPGSPAGRGRAEPVTPSAAAAAFVRAASLGAFLAGHDPVQAITPGAPAVETEEERLARERERVRGRVGPDNARPGLLVSLDVEGYLAGPGPHCRFPGDEGPGQLLEDHFGDGLMWRVRWLLTNAWGIYATGFNLEHQLFIGIDKARLGWDREAFHAQGRMPSFFFCAPLPSNPADRSAQLAYSSPRSRLLMQN